MFTEMLQSQNPRPTGSLHLRSLLFNQIQRCFSSSLEHTKPCGYLILADSCIQTSTGFTFLAVGSRNKQSRNKGDSRNKRLEGLWFLRLHCCPCFHSTIVSDGQPLDNLVSKISHLLNPRCCWKFIKMLNLLVNVVLAAKLLKTFIRIQEPKETWNHGCS